MKFLPKTLKDWLLLFTLSAGLMTIFGEAIYRYGVLITYIHTVNEQVNTNSLNISKQQVSINKNADQLKTVFDKFDTNSKIFLTREQDNMHMNIVKNDFREIDITNREQSKLLDTMNGKMQLLIDQVNFLYQSLYSNFYRKTSNAKD